ncbi:S8 family serine peptidase [Azoarcus olearius]|uniref:Subtilisin n=1 Tax=Azoarcus sp. (strain BH72) TaxID=418699 RepID=A1K4U9_AZOSB|nr:S8 family serine peptidase [Azoarcus olearius]CAL93854.1 Subtilisin [Azoarcus olearius]
MNAPPQGPLRLRVGIVDSGCGAAHPLAAAAAFVLTPDGVHQAAAQPDRLGHGSRVADIVAHLAPSAALCIAQVFDARPATSALQVAAAIDWLVAQGARVINLSLGLRAPRAQLADACARALAAGCVLCASAPALGAAVYPAAFDGVLRVTGDARCGRGEFSALASAQADFGACVHPLDAAFRASGASMGCAHLSGHIAAHLAGGGDAAPAALRAWLGAQARYGPQRPGSPGDAR